MIHGVRNTAIVSLRVGIGGLFAFAGISKLMDIDYFVSDLRDFQLLSDTFLRPVALMLIALETVCGTTVVIGFYVRTAAVVLCILLVIFNVAITINLARGNVINCGCFGILESESLSIFSLLRNVLILAAAAPLIFRRAHPISLDEFLRRRR